MELTQLQEMYETLKNESDLIEQERNSLKDENEKLNNEINALRNYNNKLFMKVYNTVEKEEPTNNGVLSDAEISERFKKGRK